MAGGIDWFRWHHGSVSDQKFVLIARRSGASVAEVIAVWACFLEQASMAADRGCAGRPDFEAMDCALGMADGRTQSVYEAMLDRQMLNAGGFIASWERRQPKRERDDDKSTDRVRAFREKQRHETPGNATERHETPREEKRREDISTPDGVEAAQAAAPKQKRGSRLPDDWFLPQQWGQWAIDKFPHFTVEIVRDEALKFANHWRSATGKTASKLDWYATWQNWCMSDICQRSHPPPGQTSETPYARQMRERVAEAAGSLAHIVAAKAPGQQSKPSPTPWDVAIENNRRTIATGVGGCDLLEAVDDLRS